MSKLQAVARSPVMISNTLKQRQHYGWMGQGGQGTCTKLLICSRGRLELVHRLI